MFFLVVTMVSGLPSAILQSMFPMILMERFQLSAEYNGYMLSGLAVIGMVRVVVMHLWKIDKLEGYILSIQKI